MKPTATFIVVLAFLFCVTTFGQAPAPPTETIASDIPGVISGGTKVEIIKSDFETSINGPVALPDGSGILICEYVLGTGPGANRITRIDNNNKITTFLENSGGALGLAFDSKGRLIANQIHPVERPRIGVIYPKGQEKVLADNFEGTPFALTNDLVVDKQGGVYFTDPKPSEGQIKEGYRALESAVYYVPPGGNAIKIADNIGRPNGIQLSPDEKILYVNNSFGDYMLAFDVQPDGTVRNRRDFAKYDTGKDSNADGLAIDGAGRLYASVRGGVQVFSPQGQYLGKIPTGGAGNVAFGGPNKKTLYVTSGRVVYKVPMEAQGFKGRGK